MTETQVSPSDEQWSRDEFVGVEFKDARLNLCRAELAIELAKQPGSAIPQACEDWADTKGAFRFFANQRVTPERIRSAHQQRTVARMKGHSLVLANQDTTYFSYSHHPAIKNLGPIGNKKQKQSGFGMHSTLATTPAGLPLGLLTKSFFTRPVDEPSHQPNDLLRKQPIEEKESYKWLQAFEQTLALAPPGVEVVTACNREADIYEMFAFAQERSAKLLVRASEDRCLAEKEIGKLWAKVEQVRVEGYITVHVPEKDEEPERDALVSVRFTTVTLKPPWRPDQKKLPPVTLQAILIREDNPPEGIEAVEWLLLTNVPVNTFQEVVQVIQWYCGRWQIEVYHKILKSGCQVEECRLQTGERLQNYIALQSIVAWRLHWMTFINRCGPELPCTVVLTAVERQVLYMRIHKTATLPTTIPTVHQAVRWIAQLGGFLGRKHDGEPGVTVIWRGWQRLQDMADTWYLVKEQTQLVGNR